MSSTNDTTSQPQGSAVPTGNPQHHQEQTSTMASASVAQSNVGGESYKCEWNANDPPHACNERLPTPEALYDHVCERHVGRKSTNNLNLTCAWGACHTTTVKRDHITSHIRVHVPLKPHKCDFCQKAFKRPQDLKKHVKTHAEDTGNYQSSPEASRSGGGPGGAFQGQPKHVADLQHLAATASGYYPDHGHAMHGQAPGYNHYSNGNPNPSAYHGPSTSYQAAGFGTTYYQVPAPAMNSEYEVRKKATFDALNEFFGDIKSRSLDARVYDAVGQRLMGLQHLPNYAGSTEYGAGPSVATASHVPLTNHYTLPMSNLRTKNDLQNIDQFLEQLQATVYEHETATQAAAAGVSHSGHAVYSGGQGYGRSSQSPPHLHASSHAQGQSLPPLTSTTAETPALTPASSVISYNSPGPVHSTAISPVSRGSMGNPYPTLPAVSSMPDVGHGYTSTSSALPSALATSFDADGRRRFSGGILQKSRHESASPDNLPRIEKLGVRSPTLSNVDPALYGSDQKTPRAQSPIDPALTDSKEAASEDFATVSRVLETIKAYIKGRLDSHDFDDEDEARSVKNETEADRDAKSLYPVLRHVQDG